MRQLMLACVLLLYLGSKAQSGDSASFNLLKQKVLSNEKDTAIQNQYIAAVFNQRKTLPQDSLVSYCTFIYEFSKKSNNYDGVGFSCATLGNIYTSGGDYTKALFYLFDAERAYLKVNKPAKLAKIYNIIGNTYLGLGKIEEQKVYFTKCYDISVKNNLKEQKALGAAGIANSYTSAKNYKESNKWNFIAEKLFKEQKYAIGYTIVLENIADNYLQLNEIDNALTYINKAEASLPETEFNYAYYGCYKGKGNILEKQYKIVEAIRYYEMALEYILKDKANHNIAEIYRLLSDACRKANRLEESIQFLNLHIQYKDSVFNENSRKQLLDIEKKYETEKKDAQIQILNKEKDLTQSELERKKILIYSTLIGIVLLLIMVFFILRSNLNKNRANRLLAKQKIIIEEKQKEILDSIHYAKRIQEALLEHKDLLNENVSDNFVLFSPKDIVSGDFYWAHKRGDLFYLAVCDSTGHGVPGAFMSLLNVGFLNEAVNEKQLTKPHEILNYVRERLINTISKEGQKDGFDGFLMCINTSTKEIEYAAANNAALLIQNGVSKQLEKDRMPVGKGEINNSFKGFKIDYQTQTSLYIFTDGYADQFGGQQGKKFKDKALRELIENISLLPMDEQKEILRKRFIEWKGSLEQIDDVCLIGIKL